MIDTLGMKVSAKTLKVRCQQHGIRAIDLLSCIPSPACRPANGSMRLLDLIESGPPSRFPLLKRK
jgi:hypothetical protein